MNFTHLTYTGGDEPGLFTCMSIQVTIRAIFNLLHFMLANFDQRFGNGGEFGGRGIKNDAIVQNPFNVCQKGLGGSVLFPFDILLDRDQVHGTKDVIFVSRKLQRVHGLMKGFHAGNGSHASQCVPEK